MIGIRAQCVSYRLLLLYLVSSWRLRNRLEHARSFIIAAALLGMMIPYVARADEAITRTFTVGPLLLRIPASYVDFSNVRKDAPDQGIVLIIRWPSMEGYYLPNGGLPPRETNRQPVLVVDFGYHRDRPSSPDSIKSRFKTLSDVYRLTPAPDDLSGLRHYQATKPRMPGLDYYFSRDESIDLLINCAVPERTLPPLIPVPYPHCECYYRSGNTSVSISFDRQYINQWMLIKEKTDSLLDDFAAAKGDNKKE
jgi:hypothetical protein